MRRRCKTEERRDADSIAYVRLETTQDKTLSSRRRLRDAKRRYTTSTIEIKPRGALGFHTT